MLFPYKQSQHPMRAMHGFVAYIFARVWCRAPNVEYGLELFEGLPALYAIMDELHRADLAGLEKGAGAFFYRYVNQIFQEFKQLSKNDIKRYKKMFLDNNNIQALCEGKKEPCRYLGGEQSNLMQTIEEFFSKLYSCGFFGLEIVKRHIGADLKGHYKSFAELNDMPCCPFCGLMPMDSVFDPTREAYDHYLPASKYPFNSVNLRNLAPACYKCNSQNKGAKDPLLNDAGIKQKAFYPYAVSRYPVQVNMRFFSDDLPTNEHDIEVELSCVGYDDEIQNWDRLYRIRMRYVAKCLSPAGGKYWLQRVIDESENYKVQSQDVLAKEQQQCVRFPWHEANFLKDAFLVEALRVNLI